MDVNKAKVWISKAMFDLCVAAWNPVCPHVRLYDSVCHLVLFRSPSAFYKAAWRSDPSDWPSVAEVSQRLAGPCGGGAGVGSPLIRSIYRNSIKVNEPAAQPWVLKVITSCFRFLFPIPSTQLSETVHTSSDPAFIEGGGRATQNTQTEGKQPFNYWGELMAGDQSPCCSLRVSGAEPPLLLITQMVSREDGTVRSGLTHWHTHTPACTMCLCVS